MVTVVCAVLARHGMATAVCVLLASTGTGHGVSRVQRDRIGMGNSVCAHLGRTGSTPVPAAATVLPASITMKQCVRVSVAAPKDSPGMHPVPAACHPVDARRGRHGMEGHARAPQARTGALLVPAACAAYPLACGTRRARPAGAVPSSLPGTDTGVCACHGLPPPPPRRLRHGNRRTMSRRPALPGPKRGRDT